MPRKDPITGCNVLTMGEFLSQEAEREGKGRTGGDILSDMMEEVGKEEEARCAQLRTPTEAMRLLNEGIKESDEADPEYAFGYKVVGVLKVWAASASFGMRQSSEGFRAQCKCDDGKERTLSFTTWHSSGSFYEPPDGETTVQEVLPAKPETPHHCPKCGVENYEHSKGRSKTPSRGQLLTCHKCYIAWPVTIPGLVDYTVGQGENGAWYVTKTVHAKVSPGDDSPEDGGIIFEGEEKQEAVEYAQQQARNHITFQWAQQSAVFVDGEEVLHLTLPEEV